MQRRTEPVEVIIERPPDLADGGGGQLGFQLVVHIREELRRQVLGRRAQGGLDHPVALLAVKPLENFRDVICHACFLLDLTG